MEKKDKKQLNKLLIIDGSNVAFHFGKSFFDPTGLMHCINYLYAKKFTNFKIVLPSNRKKQIDKSNVGKLYEKKLLYAPVNSSNSGRKSFDDIFMIELAIANDGIIVTNDQFQDLWLEASLDSNYKWKHVIRFRVVNYVMVLDVFFLSAEPMGSAESHGGCRKTVSLEDFCYGRYEQFEMPSMV